jgi:hypothetical protein
MHLSEKYLQELSKIQFEIKRVEYRLDMQEKEFFAIEHRLDKIIKKLDRMCPYDALEYVLEPLPRPIYPGRK